jgi:thioredoxin 2
MNTHIQIACPICWAINRLQYQHIVRKPMCGKCHQILFMGKSIELSGVNISHFMTRNDIPLMILFWSVLSSPNTKMILAFDDCVGTLEPHIRLARINIDSEKNTAMALGISAAQTIGIFYRNEELARTDKQMNHDEMVNWALSVPLDL